MKKINVMQWMKDRANEGTDQDEIPEGTGEFGFDVTNPIPTNTINGSNSYLNRLCTDKGVSVKFNRLGSTLSPNIKGIIDVYIISVNRQEIAKIHVSPYNRRTSNKAPKGFKLIPITTNLN